MPTPYTAIVKDSAGHFWAVRPNADTPQAYLGERVNRDGSLKASTFGKRLVHRAGTTVIRVL